MNKKKPAFVPGASDFTVWTYDRRGRGRSGDQPAFTAEREYEDLAAGAAPDGGVWDPSAIPVNCISVDRIYLTLR